MLSESEALYQQAEGGSPGRAACGGRRARARIDAARPWPRPDDARLQRYATEPATASNTWFNTHYRATFESFLLFIYIYYEICKRNLLYLT